MERSVETERIVLPARPIRQFAVETATDLRNSIRRIEQWMGRLYPDDSRLHQALTTLDVIAASGQFVSEHSTAEKSMRAIQLALDVLAITGALPVARVADLRKDLEICGRGPLIPRYDDLQPLQAQTQLVVRAALYLAGADPSQPTYSGARGRKKPDILIENGLTTYGIEVKRPTAGKNAVPRAKDGAEQLANAGLTGGIVVDVTDCLTESTGVAADNEVLTQAAAIADEFFVHGSGWKSGYSHVLMVGVIARPAWHLALTGEDEGQVLVHSTSCVHAFGTARGTLDMHRSHWMRKRLNTGLNRLGFTSEETDGRA